MYKIECPVCKKSELEGDGPVMGLSSQGSKLTEYKMGDAWQCLHCLNNGIVSLFWTDLNGIIQSQFSIKKPKKETTKS